MRYRSIRASDAAIGSGMRELRRCAAALRLPSAALSCSRSEGVTDEPKKLRRLYREERLQVRRRGGRKRALGTAHRSRCHQGPNQRWSLDFVSDSFTDSRRFRILVLLR